MHTTPSSIALKSALLAASLLLAAGTASAQAAWSSLSLSFLQPAGTVGATDTIDIWLRFANNDPTEAFTVDNSLPNGGLNLADLPTTATVGATEVNFASYTAFRLSTGFGCSGSFTASCDPGAYTFVWGANPFDSLPYTLAAGAHHDYLWGSFRPTGGTAPAGTYEFFRSVVWLDVTGLDADGNEITTVVFPAVTCRFDNAADCGPAATFTRTVTAVPEPQTYAMLASGLAVLGWVARRRRRAG